MRFLRDLLTDKTVLTVLGFVAAAVTLLLLSSLFHFSVLYALAALALLIVIWLIADFRARRRAKRSGDALGAMLEEQADRAVKQSPNGPDPQVTALRDRMVDVVRTIKTSRLGETSGSAALYELPWYIVIGKPADGKSTAIANSGLKFPFADKTGRIVQGLGGTRNCDWFFTTEGILIDTAGRYSVHDEDRPEWLSFLSLLKKHRPKAPINGIVIGCSVSDLAHASADEAIELAKQLRQRLQELTSQLGVFAPIYVVFTKADLISGFIEFFEDSDTLERERVWGATLPYDAEGKADAVALFDEHFEHLYAGLKELSLTRMAMNREQRLGAGVLAFPLEFASLKAPLRVFIATLFQDNPFQHRPVFRGFYFTSALQEGMARSSSNRRVTERFGLAVSEPPKNSINSNNGFFLKDLFSRVIFADKDLVRQYANPASVRLRFAAFFASVAALGIALGVWTYSYLGNQRLVANATADLQAAQKVQENKLDLASRLQALGILQDRIEQLDAYRDSHPLALSWGLYQGDAIETKLRTEYFAGVRQVMLGPVTESLEGFLAEVNANGTKLEPVSSVPSSAGSATSAKPDAAAAANAGFTQYKDLSPTNVEDAYNALKTYIMLADREHLEPGHLNDQLTRFWRGWLESNRGTMPREEMIRRAEKIITWTLTQTGAADYPLIEDKLILVDQTRETLRRVVKGLPARERVYAEIKARASTRYPSVTIAGIVDDADKDIVAGSYAISGAFTRAAWFGYVKEAIQEAANKELQSSDWVLKSAARDDLTLEGSPEQIEKALTAMYKTDYTREWQKFLQGIAVMEFNGFDDAVKRMNRLGDPANSPINKVLTRLFDETSWDNPSLVNQGLGKAKSGVLQWFRSLISGKAPSSRVDVNVNVDTGKKGEIEMGPIGREFAAISQLVVSRGNGDNASLLKGYLDSLSKVRTRFNQMRNAGDAGPASRQLMQQTLEGSGSELADSLRYIDESMLVGMSDSAKQTVRPLLVRPLIQAFQVIVRPTEGELNKVWTAQVTEPFQQTLANKYPFAGDSKVEANAGEIGKIFGPSGAISKFTDSSLGALVTRRGDTLTPRTWADIGIHLVPVFVANFPRYVAEQNGADAASGGGGGAGGGAPSSQQTVFQIQPVAVPGVTEYTLEIDGQQLRYRNTPPEWANFVWPNPQGTPGAKISAVTYDGKNVTIVDVPGRYGLDKLLAAAQKTRRADGTTALSWTADKITVSVNLRVISSPSSPGGSGGGGAASAGAPPRGSGLRGIIVPSTVAGQ